MSEHVEITDIRSIDADAVESQLAGRLRNGGLLVLDVNATGREDSLADEWVAELQRGSRGELSSTSAPVMIASVTPGAATQLARFVTQRARLDQLVDQQQRMLEHLIDAMSAQTVASAATVQQARRNATARQELIDEFGLYDSDQIADNVESGAKNRSATASRWLTERRVFAVDQAGRRYFPVFQFDADGRPRPVIRRVLEVFEPYGLSGWETALWFTTASGWLDDERPVDRLTAAADDVVDCARRTFDESAA